MEWSKNHQPLLLPREVLNHSTSLLRAEAQVEFTMEWMVQCRGLKEVIHCPSTTRLDSRWPTCLTRPSRTAGGVSRRMPGLNSRLPRWLVWHMKFKNRTSNRKILLNVWRQTKISVKLVRQAWADSGKVIMISTCTNRSSWTSMKCARPDRANATSSLLSPHCQDPPPLWTSWSSETTWKEITAKQTTFKERRATPLITSIRRTLQLCRVSTIRRIIQWKIRSLPKKKETMQSGQTLTSNWSRPTTRVTTSRTLIQIRQFTRREVNIKIRKRALQKTSGGNNQQRYHKRLVTNSTTLRTSRLVEGDCYSIVILKIGTTHLKSGTKDCTLIFYELHKDMLIFQIFALLSNSNLLSYNIR